MCFELLKVERDAHLRRQLLRTLAHRRHRPAYGLVVSLALDNDPRIAREAAQAIHRLGDEITGEVSRAIQSARPDRRRRLQEIVDANE